MGFFDSLKRAASSTIKREASKAVTNAVRQGMDSVGKGKNSSQTFTFSSIPSSVQELCQFPEASLDSPFKATALAMIALCKYESSPVAFYEILDFLKGPESVSPFERQFIDERLRGKGYKVRSYFEGATPENGYKPTEPYTISVYENPYSFDNENWAVMWVKSSGADNMRQIKLRKKPSTGQWFVNDIQCLSDIRVPVEEDPWA